MAEIVSEKFWLKINREELESYLREISPEELCDFELVEVQVKGDSENRVESVTFGLKYRLLSYGPLHAGPLRCGECGREDFDDENEVMIHEQTCHGPGTGGDLEGGPLGDHLREDM